MSELDRSLRSFGLEPLRIRQMIERGDLPGALALLHKEEEMLRLRSVELADLREALCEMDFQSRRGACGEISDENLEMLSAAGLDERKDLT